MGLRGAFATVCVAFAWLASTFLERTAAEEAPALIRTAHFLWRVFLEPNAAFFIVSVGVMGATSVLFCAALSRILWEGNSK